MGDREKYLREAVRLISEIAGTTVLGVSSIYETLPVGFTDQDKFLNAVVRLATTLPPHELLGQTQKIELELERTREIKWGPRTIDIDILLFGNEKIVDDRLTIPHPLMFGRAFVMVPLREVYMESGSIEGKALPDVDGIKLYRQDSLFGGIVHNSNNAIGCKIIHMDEVDSTNSYAKELAIAGASHGTAIIAQRQTQGRGRNGNEWNSSSNDGLWFSLILRPDFGKADINLITLLMAVSVVEAIYAYSATKIKCGIKWPNDIILDNKKVCGILCEANFHGNKPQFVIAGIGININQEDFQKELVNKAISLKMHTGFSYDPCNKLEIFNEVVKTADRHYIRFLKGNTEELMAEYRKHCITIGKQIKLIENEHEILCYAQGIEENGNLVVRHYDGKLQEVSAGEVSVRGICGYI